MHNPATNLWGSRAGQCHLQQEVLRGVVSSSGKPVLSHCLHCQHMSATQSLHGTDTLHVMPCKSNAPANRLLRVSPNDSVVDCTGRTSAAPLQHATDRLHILHCMALTMTHVFDCADQASARQSLHGPKNNSCAQVKHQSPRHCMAQKINFCA